MNQPAKKDARNAKLKLIISKTVVLEEKEKREERMDWARIAYHLQKPKWVFDGRGCVDEIEMRGLGVRVEGIGRTGWGKKR